MIEIGEKYLPVGTVLMLKGGSKRVVITGFCSTPNDDLERIFDYSGCLYPEGYLSSDQVCLFDHEQIATVYHLGLIDEEEKTFKEALVKYLAERGSTPSVPEVAQPLPEEVQPTPAVELVPEMPQQEVEMPVEAPQVEVEIPVEVAQPEIQTPVE